MERNCAFLCLLAIDPVIICARVISRPDVLCPLSCTVQINCKLRLTYKFRSTSGIVLPAREYYLRRIHHASLVFTSQMPLYHVLYNNSWYTGRLAQGTTISKISEGPPAKWAADLTFADATKKQFTFSTAEYKQAADDAVLSKTAPA
ncbi:hypothetical protein PILCRDRAFT_432808 [Piloderma croceum F 1598]|uniref:Uncharacterized protein n=1 Tax=Piloderma croceum (strain F 1598) TaxID=765440 RepID=A0A0C3FH40_PILCF|nr:hypothetical protein PILCRDRAFT_432808 [Piloderma croceum F 1598]